MILTGKAEHGQDFLLEESTASQLATRKERSLSQTCRCFSSIVEASSVKAAITRERGRHGWIPDREGELLHR